MKTVTIKNLMIQFDLLSEKDEQTQIDETMRSINELIEQYFDSCPQIFFSGVDKSDISIKDNNDILCECTDPIFVDNVCEKCGGFQYYR